MIFGCMYSKRAERLFVVKRNGSSEKYVIILEDFPIHIFEDQFEKIIVYFIVYKNIQYIKIIVYRMTMLRAKCFLDSEKFFLKTFLLSFKWSGKRVVQNQSYRKNIVYFETKIIFKIQSQRQHRNKKAPCKKHRQLSIQII